MARTRRRDRKNEDPVEDYNKTKAGLDEAIMSYESGETVTPGQIDVSAFPMVALRQKDIDTGGLVAATDSSAMGDMPIGEMSTTKRMKRPSTVQFAVGARGEGVGELQQFLKEQGYYAGEIDNAFGGQTEDAVKAYQRAKGLKDDGMVGANTLAALKADMTAPPAADPVNLSDEASDTLMKMKTAGYRMSPAQEFRLSRQAKAPHATNIFDFAEDIREAGATSFVPDEPFDNLYGRPEDPPPLALPRRLSREDLRKSPLVEQLLSMPKNDRAALASLLNEDTGQ